MKKNALAYPDGRPCLTSNKLRKYVAQVANRERDQRMTGSASIFFLTLMELLESAENTEDIEALYIIVCQALSLSLANPLRVENMFDRRFKKESTKLKKNGKIKLAERRRKNEI